MILTITERLALSSILPKAGDVLTLKDTRVLKEELSISQEDRMEVDFSSEYQCPSCELRELFPAPVKCGKCDVWMAPTGQVGCSDWEYSKEIIIPVNMIEIITATLKILNDSKKLEERHLSIYDKFVGEEDNESN